MPKVIERARVKVAAKPKAPPRKARTTKMCPACELTLPFATFGTMEWTADGRDTICKPCRPLLSREKGLSKFSHGPDLTSEEIIACRLMHETRQAALFQGVTHTLSWSWFLDKLEGQKWLCAETGRKLHRRAKSRKTTFAPMVKRINARYGYTPRNSKLVAHI